jgi:hypothetical protein
MQGHCGRGHGFCESEDLFELTGATAMSSKTLPTVVAMVGRCGLATALAAAIWLGPAAASAGLYEFTKIADTSGQFSDFDPWPTINGSGQVVFAANMDFDGAGLYRSDGVTTTAIDYTASGYAQSFYGTDQVINNAGEVAFFNGWAWSATSLFKWGNGTITTIAGTSSMTSFAPWNPSINDNGTVVFEGVSRTTGRKGIYSGNGGPVTTIIDTAGAFSDFGLSPAVNDSGAVAFSALSKATGKWGVYRLSSGGVLTTIADTTGSIGQLDSVAVTMNDAGQVAFMAILKSGATAILRGDGITLDTIADTNGAYGSFESQPMVNNLGTVGFVGYPKLGVLGIFTGPDPVADKIVEGGDVVNGSLVDNIEALGFSFGDNNNAAFVGHTPTGDVVFAAHPVPEPSVLGLLGAGILVLAAFAWGRRR